MERNERKRRLGSAFHKLCPRYIGKVVPVIVCKTTKIWSKLCLIIFPKISLVHVLVNYYVSLTLLEKISFHDFFCLYIPVLKALHIVLELSCYFLLLCRA